MATHRNCEGIRRRDCLKLGLGGLFGCGMVDSLRLQAMANPATLGKKKTSCILIWLDGGPSHFETFDPKPTASAEIRGEFKAIPTKVPGVMFSENMERLAAINDKFTVIRSVRHDQNNHGAGNHYMMTGRPTRIPVSCGAYVSFHPSMGSAVSKLRGAPEGMPPYFSLHSMTRSGGPNFLGARHAPFVVKDDPNSKNFRVRDVTIPKLLEDGRAINRRRLREELDGMKRFQERAAADPVLGADENYQQAVSLINSDAGQRAFQIDRESETVRDAYGRHSLGQRALLARRLVEQGVRYVQLFDWGWDYHGTNASKGLREGLSSKMAKTDKPISALIRDLRQRDLLKDTLIVCGGEFGRTPFREGRTAKSKVLGRDHYPDCFTMWMAGGGVKGGTNYGSTDELGFKITENKVHVHDLQATIMHLLGFDHTKLTFRFQGRDYRLTDVHGEVVRELIS